MRILLDHNCPRGLTRILQGHDVRAAADLGWADLSNGDLLAAAEADAFACMITADTNIRHQQRLAGRSICLIVLSTNSWPVIRDNPKGVLDAVGVATPGGYQSVDFPQPQLRRRPFERLP